MDKRLADLSEKLKSLGKEDASNEVLTILKNAQNTIDTQKWQSVLEEVNRPVPKQEFQKAIDSVISGVIGMTESYKKLDGLSEEDIKSAIEIGTKIPGAIKDANINLKVINKFAENFNSMNKTAQISWLKSLKGMGSGALKVLPFVGVVFSFLFALKNLVYGFMEYQKLTALSSEIGMHWTETLFSQKIMAKVESFKDNPDKLIVSTKTFKSAKVFADEAISFAANYIDFIKDGIFFVIEALVAAGSTIIPPGWIATLGIGAVDVSLSFLIMGIEMYTESVQLDKFDVAISKIGTIAGEKLGQLEQTESESKRWEDKDLSEFFS